MNTAYVERVLRCTSKYPDARSRPVYHQSLPPFPHDVTTSELDINLTATPLFISHFPFPLRGLTTHDPGEEVDACEATRCE